MNYSDKLKEYFDSTKNTDPLTRFLPYKDVHDQSIKVEWASSELRLLSTVTPGMRNPMSKLDKAMSFSTEPAYFRKGTFVSGSTFLVEDSIKMLADSASHMMSILRSSLLQGGINYTDYETGVNIAVPSGVPTSNVHLNITSLDDLVNEIIIAANKLKATKPSPAVSIVMNGTMAYGVGSIDHQDVTTIYGSAIRIGDFPVVLVNNLYDEVSADGTITRKYMWSPNTVSVISSDPVTPLGHSYLTVGEQETGSDPGIWVRTFDQVAGEPAPMDPLKSPFEVNTETGTAIQVGLAGLPILNKPDSIHILKIDPSVKYWENF